MKCIVFLLTSIFHTFNLLIYCLYLRFLLNILCKKQTRVNNVDELKQRLLDVWHGMEQSITDSAIDEWRWRLHSCVKAKGGHFEQLV